LNIWTSRLLARWPRAGSEVVEYQRLAIEHSSWTRDYIHNYEEEYGDACRTEATRNCRAGQIAPTVAQPLYPSDNIRIRNGKELDMADIRIVLPDQNGISDPYDLDALRVSQDFDALAGVQKIITAVPVRKPGKQSFARGRRMALGYDAAGDEGGP